MNRGQNMNRSVLRIFVVALAIGLAILSYTTYQQQQELDKLSVKVSGGTISIVKE